MVAWQEGFDVVIRGYGCHHFVRAHVIFEGFVEGQAELFVLRAEANADHLLFTTDETGRVSHIKAVVHISGVLGL